jgi:hypothetical protein
MRIRNDESGQTIVLVALSMTVLIGFLALATDVGVLFRARRNLQTAADGAAMAAALDYLYNGSVTSAQAAGQAAATANGVTNGAGGAVVTVGSPTSGPNTGKTGYFEAIITQPNGTSFMGLISHQNTVTVGSRAVAGTPTASQACIYIASPTGSDVLKFQGNTTVTAPGCGIYVNSNDPGALKVTGNSTKVTASYFNLTQPSYSGKNTPPTNPTANTPPMSDPLGNITGPTPPGGCTSTDTANSVSGNYNASGGLTSIVCFPNAVKLTNGTTLGPGLYVFQNGVTIPTGATVTVNGGTLDLYGGTLNQASNSVLNRIAPTSGTYIGIAILQPATNTTQLQVQFGSNNEKLDGIIYAPGAEVFLQDNGGGVTASGVVAGTMFIKSSTLNIPSYSGTHPTTTPFRTVTLVE